MKDAPRLLSVGEVAEILRCATKTVYRMLTAGEIPGAFKLRGVWYIMADVFFAYLEELAYKPQPTRGYTPSSHGL